MKKNYDYAVFIGRFQPFHIGHLHVFSTALETAETLLVLVGSSGVARSLRNPFTFSERETMMRASLPAELSERIEFLSLEDFIYNDGAWIEAVDKIVTQAVDSTKSVALVGHDKDETTYYLKLFPNWAYIEIKNLDDINATTVRKNYFSSDKPSQFDSDIIPKQTAAWLNEFAHRDSFDVLVQEYRAIVDYKAIWANTPYPVIFMTTDAMVRWNDEILLIQRKDYPGKNLFALPGGFLDVEETLFDGCLRELTEETQLDVRRETLKESLIKHEVFDDPSRSSRGRVITYCYYFDISHLDEKPRAVASDDAKSLAWVDIANLDATQLFEDHFFIIKKLLRSK